MSFKKTAIFLFCLVLTGLPANYGSAQAALAYVLRGRILLQVQAHGEAWYVNPDNLKRYYLGRPQDAFDLMRQLGLGVSNQDFDSFNSRAPRRLSGKILLKVEDAGKAYYAEPLTLKLYYLGRPQDAFDLMRRLGLGISDRDLDTIPAARVKPSYSATQMEREIFALVNAEREKNGLAATAWDEGAALVAREHSADLAQENRTLINNAKICSYPFIHHEGTVFGLYHNDRLNNRGVYNFSASAENIALIPAINQTEYSGAAVKRDCQGELNRLNADFETAIEALTSDAEKIARINAEIVLRRKLTDQAATIKIIENSWYTETEAVKKAVDGWMASPGHRANILNADYDQSGIGLARVNDYFIITQVFFKTADCGYQTGPCCQKTGFYPYCYQPLVCANDICGQATVGAN